VTDIANIECFDAWNGDSGRRWAQEADRRDQVLAPVADVLLDAAGLGPAERVLDIGCGCGVTTLAAAHAIGDSGRACGLDLSGPMLDIARQRRDTAGLVNAEFVQGDAQTQGFDTTFDVVISRFGTMFFADPVAAFANIAHGLGTAGRMCLATWQPLVANDWLTIPGAALLRYGTIPEAATGGPGMFGQSDPATVTSTLQAAGYHDIELTPVTVTMRLGDDVTDATNYLASSGVGRAVLETVPSEQRAAAIDAVRTVLADHAHGEGVRLDGAIWIIGAQRLR
jgi:ubiquinone/menaquinone biosynthesis C-methylase UbiE